MIKLINILLLVIVSSVATSAIAGSDNVTIVHFTEREEGIDPYPVRYIIANDLMRIDDNTDEGDFILYDDKKRIIYSVNHEDSTILIIEYKSWELAKFNFTRNVSWKKMDGAPKVGGNEVYSYWLSAGEKVCSEAQVAKGFLLRESKLLKRYTETLSTAQVDSISATPEEMRTPCLMVDKVYNKGNVYDKGFPLQQWHVNGLQRLMTSYKTDEKVSGKLFELPKDYRRYSIGDNMSFGERAEGSSFIENSPAQSQSPHGSAGF